jgi:hypothetical protein
LKRQCEPGDECLDASSICSEGLSAVIRVSIAGLPRDNPLLFESVKMGLHQRPADLESLGELSPSRRTVAQQGSQHRNTNAIPKHIDRPVDVRRQVRSHDSGHLGIVEWRRVALPVALV